MEKGELQEELRQQREKTKKLSKFLELVADNLYNLWSHNFTVFGLGQRTSTN